jgi:hypothetical protein
MRFIALLGALTLTTASCVREPATADSPCPAPIVAAYLASPDPLIEPEALSQCPEVCRVRTLEELQIVAADPVAIWIDIGSADLVDTEWLQQPPQRYYPLVLVGYGTALYAFRDFLGLSIGGPAVEWGEEPPTPGFSVWMIEEETGDSQRAILRGYEETIEVGRILELSRDLLGGASVPTASSEAP